MFAPKTRTSRRDGGDYSTGSGPQNDAVRISHYVRPVRDAEWSRHGEKPEITVG